MKFRKGDWLKSKDSGNYTVLVKDVIDGNYLLYYMDENTEQYLSIGTTEFLYRLSKKSKRNRFLDEIL